MQLLAKALLLLAVLLGVLADTFYDDLGVGQDADEATIKKVRAAPAALRRALAPGR